MLIVAVAGAPAVQSGAIGTEGWFHTDCGFSHRAPDDPIVYPGQPGKSHMHDFLGNRSLDANSTPESLVERVETSCLRSDELKSDNLPADRSGYWVPALYAGGTSPIAPTAATAGYSVGPRDYAKIRPFPADLRMIAGTSTGGAPQIGIARIYLLRCGGKQLVAGTDTRAPLCDTPDLRLDIHFPDCWDGADPDSADHKSHMAYSQPTEGEEWKCPASHPILVPRLILMLRYPTTGGPGVRLASGAIDTAHADFMNGWAPGKLGELVRSCLNVDQYCGGTNSPVLHHGNPIHRQRCAKARAKVKRAKAKLRELNHRDRATANQIARAREKVKGAKQRRREACA